MSWAQIASTPPPEKTLSTAPSTPSVGTNARTSLPPGTFVPPRPSNAGPKKPDSSRSSSPRSRYCRAEKFATSHSFERTNSNRAETRDRRGSPSADSRRGRSYSSRGRSETRGFRGGENANFSRYGPSRDNSGGHRDYSNRAPSKAERPLANIELRPEQVAKLANFVRFKAADLRNAREQSGKSCDWMESASSAYRAWETEYENLMKDGGVDQNPAGQAWIRANKTTAFKIAHREPTCILHALATDPAFLRGAAICLATRGEVAASNENPLNGYSRDTFVRCGFRFDNECIEAIVRECVYPSIASSDSYRDGDEMIAAMSKVSESTLWPDTASRENDLASAAVLASELATNLPEVDEEDLATMVSDANRETTEGRNNKVNPVFTSGLWSDIVDECDVSDDE